MILRIQSVKKADACTKAVKGWKHPGDSTPALALGVLPEWASMFITSMTEKGKTPKPN